MYEILMKHWQIFCENSCLFHLTPPPVGVDSADRSGSGKLPELPPKETFMVEGLTRETVKLRGWVFYDLPDGQGAGMSFLCHEEVMGWSAV